MIRKNLNNVQMISRVVEFYPAHADLFTKNELAAESFAALGNTLSKVSEQASLQIAGANELRTRSVALAAVRETLEKQMQRITDTAWAISIDKPGFQETFRMPKVRSNQALIQSAKAFANEAAVHKDNFVKHGLSETFIETLQAAAGEFEQAILNKASSKNKRANATKAVDEAIAECQRLLARLDAIVTNLLADNPPALAEWNITRHVARRSKREATSTPSDPPPSTTT